MQNQRAVSAYLLSKQIGLLYLHFPRQSGCHRDRLVWGRHSEACIGYIYTLYEIADRNIISQILKYLYFADKFILF